jgi:hypothetical protein
LERARGDNLRKPKQPLETSSREVDLKPEDRSLAMRECLDAAHLTLASDNRADDSRRNDLPTAGIGAKELDRW